jgi:hypothetical protein
MAFEINKDSVNFTDNSQSICLINRSSAILSIDTIKLCKATKSIIAGNCFSFDTIANRGRFGPGAPYCYSNEIYNEVGKADSCIIYVGQQIKIFPNDSVKLFAGSIVMLATSTLSKKLAIIDTLRMVMISSTNERDSVIAIVPIEITGKICNQIHINQPSIVSRMTYYLLNGRMINNSKGIMPNIIIEKASNNALNHDRPHLQTPSFH